MCDGIVGTVKVKPLVWDVTGWQSGDGIKGENDDTWSASAHGFQCCGYCIDWHGGADFRLTDPDDIRTSHSSLAAAKAAAQADYEARIMASLDVQPITVQDAAETDAERFDRADWFWRVMDPDDSADTPSEAIHRGMIGDYCVCKIASSYTGPVRFGFTAPVLDPDSDDTEFLHFETQQEAIDAAKARAAALRAIADSD